MCGGGSAPEDHSAEIAAQKEAERQARIAAGTKQINSIFGAFGDDYYDGVAKAYSEHYLPLVDEQYADAKKALVLSAPGGVGSSAYAKRLGDLEKQYLREQVSIGERAAQQANQYRGDVATNRQQLLAQLEAGTGVDTAASLAAERAKALNAPQAFSPLGDIFGKFTADAANYSSASQNIQSQQNPLLFGGKGGSSSGNALRIVN